MVTDHFPMIWDFEVVIKRVKRAEEHRRALDQAIQRFIRGEPPPIPLDIQQRLQAKGRQPPPHMTKRPWSLVLESKPDLKVGDEAAVLLAFDSSDHVVEWGIILGELVHNLRASLDNVAWIATVVYQGRKYHTSPPPRPLPGKWRDIAFPIVVTPSDWPNQKDKHLWGVSPEAVQYFEEEQPYNTRQPALCILRELSNIDKHQWINLLGTNVDIKEVQVPPGLIFTPQTTWELESHAEVGRLRFLGEEAIQRYLEHKVDLNLQVTFKVAFGKGTAAEGNP